MDTLLYGGQKTHGRVGGGCFGAQQGEVGDRWHLRAATFGQCGAGKGRVTLGDQQLQQRVLRVTGLDQHFTGAFMATGATGHLHDQLGHALTGAEVGAEQAVIGVEDADQCDVRKMVTLGKHLRAQQQATFAAGCLFQ